MAKKYRLAKSTPLELFGHEITPNDARVAVTATLDAIEAWAGIFHLEDVSKAVSNFRKYIESDWALQVLVIVLNFLHKAEAKDLKELDAAMSELALAYQSESWWETTPDEEELKQGVFLQILIKLLPVILKLLLR